MVRWADPEPIAQAVRAHAESLHARRPVSRIYWYGSWVSGTPTPSSEVDLCVVVESDDRPSRERTPDYLPDRFPVGVDVVVFTEELDALAERAPGWHRAIVEGREV